MKKNFLDKNLIYFKDSDKKVYLYLIIGLFILTGIFFLASSIIEKKIVPGIKMVSGTEYISGEQGQIIVRLEDSLNKPIKDANCNLSLLYPDKSFFLIDVPMMPTSVPGNYYHAFTTPFVTGIYEEYISCQVVKDATIKNLSVSYSFHVSPGLNLIVEISKAQNEQYNDLVARINSLDSNIRGQINSVDMRLYGMQTYIDGNVMDEINNLNLEIQDINISLNDSVSDIEKRLNSTMTDNFENFYNKFRSSYDAMADIFGGE